LERGHSSRNGTTIAYPVLSRSAPFRNYSTDTFFYFFSTVHLFNTSSATVTRIYSFYVFTRADGGTLSLARRGARVCVELLSMTRLSPSLPVILSLALHLGRPLNLAAFILAIPCPFFSDSQKLKGSHGTCK
jgi:hypothetical protein